MITPDGWLDWATRWTGRIPQTADGGPKLNPRINTAQLYIPHSAVGYWGGFKSRIIDGPAAASVHGWIAYDGSVMQIYPFTACCWASGSDYPNDNGIAFENEGGFDPENEPLTDAQVLANARIIRDLGQWKRRGGSYWRRPVAANDKAATLYEHRECVRFGSAPTACPSGRIPWPRILAALPQNTEEEDAMANGISWVEWKDRPADDTKPDFRPYRSWLLYVTPTGWVKEHVSTAEDHTALAQSGVVGDKPKPVSIWTIKRFRGKPEPDDK